ncbi:MAG: B12-binding domain-containing radical SAM protein [Candidatus Omnitrophica bacterium]|nr:B12-binding domain-containing radical SAM protein [Candidatus Omnitrophota bacterium]
MSDIDALLVLPPMYQFGRIPDYNPKEPMGLMYIGAALRHSGCSIEILDADILALTLEQTVTEIIKRQAKIIGFSVMQRALPSVKLLVEKLRNKGVLSHVCCGGFSATLSAKHILERIPEIDSIVLGEGELTFSHLTKAIKESFDWKHLHGIAFKQNGMVVINQPTTKTDIDSLPWPSRDLLPVCFGKTNYATIVASRGCYGICTFCSNQAFERTSVGSNWRGRNPIDVVDEIEKLRTTQGVRIFKFNDPNLFGPGLSGRQHVVNICNEIITRSINDLHLMGFCRSNDIDMEIALLMKRAGFERILIGIESANPTVLSLFRKGESLQTIEQSIKILRQAGIDVVPGFMIFNPYTTIETLEKDLDFLETWGLTPTLSKSLRIFDGTPLQEIMASENRLVWRSPFEGYHEYLVDSSVASIYMALKTISVEWIDLFRKTYQGEIWNIKKAPAFNQRLKFDALCNLIFALEKETLKSLLSWTKSGFSHQDIVKQIARLKDQLIGVEQHIIFASGLIKPTLNVQSFSVPDLAGRIQSILVNKIFRTFPEQYRWKDD